MHRKFTYRIATVLLILAVALLWVLRSPRDTSKGSEPGVDGLTKPRAETQNTHQAPHSSTATRPQRVAEQNPSLSSPSWRPSAAFGKTMAPAPAREFPRGVHQTRRYHLPVIREVNPEISSRPPSVLARSPDDGRFHLLPEEIDDHTLQAGRMAFDPASLDQIINGQTSLVLAPTLTKEVLALEFKTVKTRNTTTHTLQGHVVGEETTSLVQIVYHDGIIHGSVVRYDSQQELEYRILADGYMMVRELDHSTMTAGCSTCDHEIMADVLDESAVSGDGKYDPSSEPEVPIAYETSGWRTIDVTVGYTAQARIADGGNSQIEARIIASVDRMTLAFANSAIANTELILVGTIEDPDYVEHATQQVFDAHSKLRNETDGYLDAISDFHNRLGSDLASIIVSSVQTGGVAGVAVSGSWSSANARSQMTSSQMTFEHELGHNLGCAHAWGDTSEGNIESNMGWRFLGTSGTKYTTIMAYTHVSSWGARIPYYSNPNVLHPDGNVPTGCEDGYDATNDPTVDPALKLGYNGSVPTRGADNARTIDTGDGNASYGATAASNRATRTDFEILTPAAAAHWEKGTTRTISFNGGDMDDLATIKLYKGGVLHTTLASGVNAATHRNLAWTIPFGLTDGSDYMIRVELDRNGSSIFADSALFEIFSNLPHVNAASAPAVPAVIGQISSLILTFNVPMNPATFTAGTDVVSFLNPEGSSILGTITSATWSAGDTVLTLQFTPPSLQGSYQIVLGTDIEDMAGNKMDQDGDGTTGESIQDRYTATFTVNPPLIHYDNMDTNPGWTFSANNPADGWAWGQPTGGTGYGPYGIVDPASGYNGANVIGYNLTGDYERGITETRWATTPVMDCSNYENVRLRFQRWLGVYYGASSYEGSTISDNAYIEVSNDGTTWTPVWHNTSSRLTTAAWAEVEYDISAVADGQSTVYIRWGMGKTNSSLNDDSCGWNIDEVMVHGDYVDSSDFTPPFTSPMTFASAPTALGVSAMTMTATTALDANGVEYYFDETSGNPGGTDSGWQDSPTYTDTGLQVGTQYTYTVKARDKSPAQNETGASAPASATTDAGPTLTLFIAVGSIGESDGSGATTATVTRNTDTTSTLLVNLSSSDSTEATVPASVTIAAGQSTSSAFNVNAVNDAILDGTQTVTLTATAAGHANGSDTLNVTDDLPLTLTVVTGANGESTIGGGPQDPDGSPFAISATPATGYSFGQWTVVSGDVTFGNEANASTTIDTIGDATVQANFIVGIYMVSYAGNGSDGGSVPVDASSPYDYNTSVTVLDNTGLLTRTGHSFTGWNTASNGSGTSYVAGNSFNIAGDTTLSAQWTPETYTISYDGNGNTGGTVPDSQPKTYGQALNLASNSGDLTKTGYSFIGWNTAANGNGTAYAADAIYTANSAETLYAQWAVNTYAVTYDGNESTSGAVSNQTKTHDVNLTLSGPGTLIRTGHVFTGWNTAADGTGTDYAANTLYSTNAPLALYAQWDRPPTLFALNPSNGATGASSSGNLTVTFSEDIAFGSGAITLRQSDGTLVESFNVASPPASLTLSGATVTLNPTSELALGTSYYVEIDATAIDDLTGNSFAGFSGNGTWNFAILPLTLADSYLTLLDAATPATIVSSLNFPSILDGPLTGSSTLTTTGYFGSLLSFVGNSGNTFTGNLIVNGGTLRIAGSPFASNGGFVTGSMTSSDTITINRAGILTIDDNVTGGYTANRFGSDGNRPAINLAGGTITLSGLNNASSSVQTFGDLTASSGQANILVTRNSNGNPTLAFDSLAINSGSLLTFNGTALGTGASDARITFASGPTLTNGILAGARFYSGSPGTSEFVAYGASGVTTFTAYDVSSNNINGATSAQNVKLTAGAGPTALTGDTAVNSLNYAGTSGWSLGGFKLTIGSGMLLRTGDNSDPNITNGTLTAGDGVNDIDLNIIVAQNNMTIGAVIADNSASDVTLVKSGDGRSLTLNASANNTYTGGTSVVGGTLSTGTTANLTYLGTGKVTVDNATLSLGNIGATSNSTGADYTASNGGRIIISNNNHGIADTFNIAANSIIAGASGSGTGLASLSRGTNITLASGAIIGQGALSAALNTSNGTIQNLGTNADLFYGLTANQNNASGSINIGNGTAFKGISTDRSARAWQLGTINIASGTTSVDFQGLPAPDAAPLVLTLGNGTTANAPVITFAGSGTMDINAIGSLALNDDAAVYGNQNVRFISTAGSTLTVTTGTGMGSGTGIASALVQNGGTLAISNASALNGAVTVQAGGRFNANQAAGLTGTGTLTFNEGSILNITSQVLGFSGTQASAASIAAGTIVRLGVNNFGAAGTTLDSIVGGSSPIYQMSTNVAAANPTDPGTTIITLNKNGSGVGGILTNDFSSRSLSTTTNGVVTLGTNGGVIAATSGTELQVQENIEGTNVTLTIGTTDIIDGAPKLGTVALGPGVGGNGYTGGTIIHAGTLRAGYANVLGSLTNQLTVNTGGTLNMSGSGTPNQTVGNLTGTGGIINLGGQTLTIGEGDNGGGNYQGLIQGSGGKITKVGAGTITLSGSNTYTGVTAINAGTLLINGDQSTATGNVTVAQNASLSGTGTLGGNTTISPGGKLEFDLSTLAASHNPLNLIAGKALTFSGTSTLTITSTSGASPGTYTLVTGGNNIVGVAPATLNLPANWAATVSISGNTLLLHVTSTGNTFANWIGGFTGLDGQTAFDDDPDGDGIKNGVESHFGTNPGEFSAGVLPVAVNQGAGTFTFTHPLNATPLVGITGSYRWSKDLVSFHADGATHEGTTVSFNQSAPANGMVTVTATITGTPVERLFVNVEVTQN